jgi:hypothetical protein
MSKKEKPTQCEYCGEMKPTNPETNLCQECESNFKRTINEFFDGDPLLPLKMVEKEVNKRLRRGAQ